MEFNLDMLKPKPATMINFKLDEIKSKNQENFEVKELIPGLLISMKEKETPGLSLSDQTAAFEPEPTIYFLKLMFPINEKNTVMFATQTAESRSMKSFVENTGDLVKSGILENLKLPEFDFENLSVNTMSEKFQDFTKKLKEDWEKLTGK